ncbi:MAG: hypothetical protein IID44_26845 [Planctomycetes bacterium]|nr:hypothetical protein [Planctomycetota bacterium]
MAASREHQGLTISLIIFVMLWLVMSVISYVLYSRDEEAIAKVTAADDKMKEWRTKAEENQGMLNEMKKMVGFVEADSFDKVRDKWKEDKEIYEEVYVEEGDLDYSKLVAHLADEIRQLDSRLQVNRKAVATLNLQIAAAATIHLAELEKKDATFATANNAFVVKVNGYDTRWEKYTRDAAETAKKFSLDKRIAAEAASKANTTITDINDKFQLADRLAKEAISKLNKQTEIETEVADGRITSTNQTTNRVYVNLGRADALRPRITFSVHGQNVANVAKAKPKAKIIITRLLDDPHMAEAQIVEESLSDPIIRGDKLFSPLWSPGRKIRFAFAGTVDIDGDGRSDMKRIRDLVAINNGIIDAWPGPDGAMVGAGITTNTRYLVVGDAKLKDAAATAARTSAIDKARENGVQQLSVVEFLDMVGWKNSRRTIRLGRGAKDSGFTRRKSTDSFKPRRP